MIAALKLSQELLAPLVLALVHRRRVGAAGAGGCPAGFRAGRRRRGRPGTGGSSGRHGYSLSDQVATFSESPARHRPRGQNGARIRVAKAGPPSTSAGASELQRAAAPPETPGTTPVTIVEPVDVQKEMMNGVSTTASFAGQVILSCFLIYFLLASGDQFKAKFVKISGPQLSAKRVTVQMIDEMMTKIGRFVFYQVWSGAVVGIVTWLAFLALGMRYAACGDCRRRRELRPYFGPTVVMAGVGLCALLQFHSIRWPLPSPRFPSW